MLAKHRAGWRRVNLGLHSETSRVPARSQNSVHAAKPAISHRFWCLTMRLLHPLTPFITEELWQRLAANTAERPKSLALAAYPQYSAELADVEAERKVEALQNAITAVRTLKAELGLDPKAALAGTFFGHVAYGSVTARAGGTRAP